MSVGHPHSPDEIARAAAQEVWAAYDFLIRCGVPAKDITPLITGVQRSDGTTDTTRKLILLNVNSRVARRPFNVSVCELFAPEDVYQRQYQIWIKSCRPQPGDTEMDIETRDRVLTDIFENSQIWNGRRAVINFLLERGVRVPDALVHL